MERSGELDGRLEPEVPGHETLELALLAATVLTAGRSGNRSEPDGPGAVHEIAADGSERGETHLLSVGRNSHAVHAGAAGHRDAPAALTARP